MDDLIEMLERHAGRATRDGYGGMAANLRAAIAELRRVREAPVRIVGESVNYAVSVVGSGIENGDEVRLVPVANHSEVVR